MISVIILTKNEEKSLPSCLNSLDWCNDIHIVDSGSTDAALANISTAIKTYNNPFKSFGQQRNWALTNCKLLNPWVLFLDADEQTTPEFVQEMQQTIATTGNVGFYCCWKLLLNGQWVKYADSFPRWQMRLLKLGFVDFTDAGHGQKEGKVTGTLGYIRAPYLHFAYAKGWSDWFSKHNHYSDIEAQARLVPIPFKQVFSKHGSQRNVAIKYFVTRFPLWPWFRFFYSYILRGGVFDGARGYTFAMNMLIYEQMIQTKIKFPNP